MGPTWVLLAPDGPHVGPNLAIRAVMAQSISILNEAVTNVCEASASEMVVKHFVESIKGILDAQFSLYDVFGKTQDLF